MLSLRTLNDKHVTHTTTKPRDPYLQLVSQHLDFLGLKIDISNKLFNPLYLPILMYGSEVWSIYDKDD